MKLSEHMKYEGLLSLRDSNPAWRLLAAEQCSFIAAFLYDEFIVPARGAIAEPQLLEDLENYIYSLHDVGHGDSIIRPAKEYLSSWSDSQHSWLRKFYSDKNEACYDLTAAAHKAIDWLISLKKQSFIGTESRLKTVFGLLEQIDQDTNPDKAVRLAVLNRKKQLLEAEIAALEEAEEAPVLNALQTKERFIQAAELSRDIMADFREVEENFRELERSLMERIITWKKGKGELLEHFFSERDYILHSDQGRSFTAFWNYLMNSDNNDYLERLLSRICGIESISELEDEYDMRHIRRDWARSAGKVQNTLISLSRQLRQYVDEDFLNEERYIYSLISSIEDKALKLKDNMPRDFIMEMDSQAPDIELPMDRPLFVPPRRPQLDSSVPEKAEDEGSVDSIFQQIFVDKDILAASVAARMEDRESISLSELIKDEPLRKGLTELLTYMLIASGDSRSFDDNRREEISFSIPGSSEGSQQGRGRVAELDRIVFHRREAE